MMDNLHKPGNMAVLVGAPKTGLRTIEDARTLALAFSKTTCTTNEIIELQKTPEIGDYY